LLAKAPVQPTNLLLMSRNQTVGASLLAIAVVHSALMLADTAPSRASSLLQGIFRLTRKKSTYIQFSSPSHRHYRIGPGEASAGGFSFVQVDHEHFAMG
jgi:hypothetical protein